MSLPPPPPPPPGSIPPGSIPPPPPGSSYPGSGATGFTPAGPEGSVVYQYGMTPPGAVPRASYAARLVAFVIDSVLLYAPIVIAFVFARVGPRETRSCRLTPSGDIAVYGDDDTVPGFCDVPTGGSLAVIGLLLVGAVVLWFAYFAHEGRSGRTVGKRLLGIRLVDRNTGAPIGGGRNIARNLLRAVLAFPFGFPWLIDHLWPLWDRDGQALHDKVVGAVVVPADATWP